MECLIAVSSLISKCSAIYCHSSFPPTLPLNVSMYIKALKRVSFVCKKNKTKLSANNSQTLWPTCFICFCWKESKFLFLSPVAVNSIMCWEDPG